MALLAPEPLDALLIDGPALVPEQLGGGAVAPARMPCRDGVHRGHEFGLLLGDDGHVALGRSVLADQAPAGEERSIIVVAPDARRP